MIWSCQKYDHINIKLTYMTLLKQWYDHINAVYNSNISGHLQLPLHKLSDIIKFLTPFEAAMMANLLTRWGSIVNWAYWKLSHLIYTSLMWSHWCDHINVIISIWTYQYDNVILIISMWSNWYDHIDMIISKWSCQWDITGYNLPL